MIPWLARNTRQMVENFHPICLWREGIPGVAGWKGLIYWQTMALHAERHLSSWVQSRKWTCTLLARAGPFSFIPNLITFLWVTPVRERRESVWIATRVQFHLWLISHLIFAFLVSLETSLISSRWGCPMGLTSWHTSAAITSGSDRGDVMFLLNSPACWREPYHSWGRLVQSSRLLSWVCRFWDCCGSASQSPRRKFYCCVSVRVTGVVLVILFIQKTGVHVATEERRTDPTLKWNAMFLR